MNDSSAPYPSSPLAWSAVGIFFVAAVLSYTDRQILSLLVDPIRQDLGVSDTQISLLQGLAFAIIYAFAGLPLGRMADIMPRRLIILAGVLLWSAATAWCGLAKSFGSLFAARVFVGVGEAALAPAAMSMIIDYFPARQRGAASGLFLMGMMAGSGVAIALGGVLLELTQAGVFAGVPWLGKLPAWRLTMLLLGAPGLAVAVLIAGVREPIRRNSISGAGAPPIREVLLLLRAKAHVLVPLYAALAMTAVGEFSVLNWAPATLARKFGMSPGEIGAALGTLVIVTALVGSILGGMISDRRARRLGSEGRLPLAFVAAALGLVGTGVVVATSGWEALMIFTIWLLMAAASNTIGITVLQEFLPNEARGLGVSLASFFNMIVGLGAGTSLTAVLTDRVFADPRAVAASITTISLPAGLAAAWCYWRAWSNTRHDPRLTSNKMTSGALARPVVLPARSTPQPRARPTFQRLHPASVSPRTTPVASDVPVTGDET